MTVPGAARWESYRALLATYLRPQRARVALLAAVLVGDIGLQLVNPQILRAFINAARAGASDSTLATMAALFIVVVLATQAVASLATYCSEGVGWTATNNLRADLTRHCLRLDASFHKQHSPGALLERVDGDVAVLSNFFSAFIVRVLGGALLLVGILALIAHEDWRVGLALTAYTALTLWVLRRAQGLSVPAFKAWRQASADLSGFWEEHLSATEVLRSCGAEGYALARQDELMGALLRDGRKTLVLGRAFQSVLEVLTALGTALAFAFGAYLLDRGTITLGTVFLIFAYTGLLANNLGAITTQLNDLQGVAAAVARIGDLYNTEPAVADGRGVALPPGPLAVAFRGVSFGYRDGDLVLHDLSFDLAPGHILGVLGRTGSGKTTLARLLPRFYDPSAGTVLLSGIDVRTVQLDELRRRIGLVTQDVQVFTATLRDNLTLFGAGGSDERILKALRDLGLFDWYERLPRGLDTEIAPDRLSAGEAQVLALARVFLKDPDLVILDEASSRLDPATERLIERALDRLLRGRTSIIIAHRLATVARADGVLILDDGRVVEHGPRARLAADPQSRFAHLLRTGLVDVEGAPI